VDTAKQAIAAQNRGDDDAFAELTTSHYESWPAVPGIVEGTEAAVYRGREGIERASVEIAAAWADHRVVAEEVRDLGDRVLVLGHTRGRGLGSGVPVRAPWGCILDFSDGKISRSRGFLDHGEALRAAGLEA
jgi:ketosteroid isomerase-like protein